AGMPNAKHPAPRISKHPGCGEAAQHPTCSGPSSRCCCCSPSGCGCSGALAGVVPMPLPAALSRAPGPGVPPAASCWPAASAISVAALASDSRGRDSICAHDGGAVPLSNAALSSVKGLVPATHAARFLPSSFAAPPVRPPVLRSLAAFLSLRMAISTWVMDAPRGCCAM
ncbi:MAG: hypothetical protein J3K34DRAFT_415902, partial [Monoraphidium minutum]